MNRRNSPARPARAMLRREIRAEAGPLLVATLLAACAAVLATFAAWLMAPLGALLFPAGAGAIGSMPLGNFVATIPLATTPAGIALLLAGTYLAKNAAEYAARGFADAASVRTESRIRTDGWRALWDGAAPYVRPDRQADIAHSLIADAAEAAAATRIGPVRIVGDPLTALGYLGTMLWISPALALGLLLLVPFGGRLTRRGLRAIARAADERARTRAALGARMSELVSLGPVIRAHEAGAWAVAALGSEDERAREASLAWARRVRAAPQVVESVGALAGAAIIGVGLGEIGAGTLTGPAFLTFLTALFLLLPAVKRLAALGGDLRTALAAWDRIGLRANREPVTRVRESGPDLPPGIFLRDLSVRGRDGNPPLRVDRLDIPAGALVAVVGPTGAGKSLLLDIIAGLIVPERGTVVREPGRGRIGYVPQEGWVARGTAGENVALGRSLAPNQVENALADAALAIPAAVMLGEGGAPLSGGERQRLALARAFAGDPPLLVLDEPTAALDAATEAIIVASLRARHGKATIVVATHRSAIVEAADLVIDMHGGAVVSPALHTFDRIADA